MRRWITLVIAIAVVLLLRADGWAASPTEQLRGFFAAAARILDDPEKDGKPEERLIAIRTIVGDMFDFRGAAQLSLGAEWNARTPAERTEFVRVFSDLLARSYIVGIASRIRFADGVQVSYLGESIDGALATVRTVIASKSGLDLPFSYRMIERGGRWAIRDVVIDGVSLAQNYRAQFVHVIQTSSYRHLVRQMRARMSGGPAMPLAATSVEDGHPTVAVTLAPAPTETTETNRPEAASPQALPAAAPAFRADDLARDGRAAEAEESKKPEEPAPTRTADARAEPPAARPRATVGDGPVMAEPGWGAPEPRVQLRGPQVIGTTPRPANPSASRARSYWVQVGAFVNAEAANRLQSRLREHEPSGAPERWMVFEAASPHLLARVRIGPFPDRAAAAAKLRELQARGYTPFIAEDRASVPPTSSTIR